LHAFVAGREEPELIAVLGAAYRDYCARVLRSIPSSRPLRSQGQPR